MTLRKIFNLHDFSNRCIDFNCIVIMCSSQLNFMSNQPIKHTIIFNAVGFVCIICNECTFSVSCGFDLGFDMFWNANKIEKEE